MAFGHRRLTTRSVSADHPIPSVASLGQNLSVSVIAPSTDPQTSVDHEALNPRAPVSPKAQSGSGRRRPARDDRASPGWQKRRPAGPRSRALRPEKDPAIPGDPRPLGRDSRTRSTTDLHPGGELTRPHDLRRQTCRSCQGGCDVVRTFARAGVARLRRRVRSQPLSRRRRPPRRARCPTWELSTFVALATSTDRSFRLRSYASPKPR